MLHTCVSIDGPNQSAVRAWLDPCDRRPDVWDDRSKCYSVRQLVSNFAQKTRKKCVVTNLHTSGTHCRCHCSLRDCCVQRCVPFEQLAVMRNPGSICSSKRRGASKTSLPHRLPSFHLVLRLQCVSPSAVLGSMRGNALACARCAGCWAQRRSLCIWPSSHAGPRFLFDRQRSLSRAAVKAMPTEVRTQWFESFGWHGILRSQQSTAWRTTSDRLLPACACTRVTCHVALTATPCFVNDARQGQRRSKSSFGCPTRRPMTSSWTRWRAP
jgi:hypothetical protein